MLRFGSGGIWIGFLSAIEYMRSKKLAFKLTVLSEFSLPKNFVAWLVGIRIVHLFLIVLVLRGQLLHGDIVIGGVGYKFVNCDWKEHCQWVISVKFDAVGWQRALPVIIWLFNNVMSQGLACFKKWLVV